MNERARRTLLIGILAGVILFLPAGAIIGWRLSERSSNHRVALRPIVEDLKTIVTIEGAEVRASKEGSGELVRKHDLAEVNSGDGFVRFVIQNHSVDIVEAIYCFADDRVASRVAPLTVGTIYGIERLEPNWYYIRSEH